MHVRECQKAAFVPKRDAEQLYLTFVSLLMTVQGISRKF